ncbi:Sec-independent protein translocase TatB [Microbacterium sp. NPDC007973]|uniref:Sec-independent protein translocase TatB n=1 Tax=Microbacterium sp. NPDC007973 TaxID=3364182 RepID=UPI0036EC780A
MFGLTFEKLVLVGLIAAVVLGPQRLPVVVGRAAALVRDLRRTVDAARVRAAEEIGVPVDAPQWRALDPRRYDPRRIVAEALAAPSVEATVPAGATASVITTNSDAADTASLDPVVAPASVPMRRVRVGTSAHPRWIEVAVPSESDPATSAAEDATAGAPVTA